MLDPEDQILLAEAGEVADVQLFSQVVKLTDVLAFELCDVHGGFRLVAGGISQCGAALRAANRGTT